jgi:hypothetical protein
MAADDAPTVYTRLARLRLLLDEALDGDAPSRAGAREVARGFRELRAAIAVGQSDYERQLVDTEIETARTRILAAFGIDGWDDESPA